MYVCMYDCIYYVSNILPHICRTMVPEIRVRPEMLRVFRVYWRAHVCDLQLNSKDDWSYALLAMKIIHEESKTGKWMCRHMVQTDLTYWDSGTVAARQLANVPVWLRNDRWAAVLYCCTVLLFCNVHANVGTTLNLLQCLCVICECNAVQTISAETSLTLLAIITI